VAKTPTEWQSYDAAAIQRLVAPSLLRPLDATAYKKLARYVQLLHRWNARMNLTAVRDAQVFVTLHLAECLLAGQLAPETVATAMDFGSGAGLPGIPMAIARPELAIALVESQCKKAAFLGEAVRELGLGNATVFGGRVEAMAEGRQWDMVVFRAVDKMEEALQVAWCRIREGGRYMVLTTEGKRAMIEGQLAGMAWDAPVGVPGSEQRVILRGRKGGG
jgi:16S rRNA (guanine527-N7)-methyltransferase